VRLRATESPCENELENPAYPVQSLKQGRRSLRAGGHLAKFHQPAEPLSGRRVHCRFWSGMLAWFSGFLLGLGRDVQGIRRPLSGANPLAGRVERRAFQRQEQPAGRD